jgi:hypothetical protein
LPEALWSGFDFQGLQGPPRASSLHWPNKSIENQGGHWRFRPVILVTQDAEEAQEDQRDYGSRPAQVSNS